MLAQGALVQIALVAIPSGAGGVSQNEGRWHQPWSEPVRFRATRADTAKIASGLFFFPVQPIITVDEWFRLLSEPARFLGAYPQQTKPGRFPADQQFFIPQPNPLVSFSWYAALGGPAPPPKLGLAVRLQQTLAQPPRLLPTPTITGTMNAITTKNTALFEGLQFAPPATAEIGIIVRP